MRLLRNSFDRQPVNLRRSRKSVIQAARETARRSAFISLPPGLSCRAVPCCWTLPEERTPDADQIDQRLHNLRSREPERYQPMRDVDHGGETMRRLSQGAASRGAALPARHRMPARRADPDEVDTGRSLGLRPVEGRGAERLADRRYQLRRLAAALRRAYWLAASSVEVSDDI